MTEEMERIISELPDRVSADAPSELVAAARAEAAGVRSRRRRALRNRGVLTVAAGIALVGVSFTAPGRAATGWIADVAGIGEEPTLPQVGSVRGSAIVLASGTLSDGTPYEIVAKRINAESFAEAATDSEHEAEAMLERPGFGDIPESVCFQVDWPGLSGKGQGGACTDSNHTGQGNIPVLETTGLYAPQDVESNPSSASGGPLVIHHEGPAIFMGLADSADVADVRVVQVDRDGNEDELASDLLTVDGMALERIGGKYPVSVFFAALDEDVVAAGDGREAQVSAIAYDHEGEELDRTAAFPPLDCPLDPSELVPEPPAIPEAPHPATPEDREGFERAMECGVVPSPPSRAVMDQAPLEREPLSATVRADAARLGVSLEPATEDELASVFTDDFSGSTAIDAMRHSPYEPPVENAGYSGPTRIYLARDADSGRLVYALHRTVNAVVLPDGSRDREVDGLPREYLSIVEVMTGDSLVEVELD